MINLSLFDLDHTLIQSNSSYRFGRYLYRRNLLAFRTMLSLVFAYIRHSYFGLSLFDLHRHSFQILCAGRPKAEFTALVDEFLDEYFEALLFPPVVERLRACQEAGHHTVILSSSPDFIVERVAQRLGASEWHASEYAVDDRGVFSHVESVMDGARKARWVESIQLRLGLAKEQVAGFSDSLLDLPFLEATGHPVGVGSAKKFREFCRQRQWEFIG